MLRKIIKKNLLRKFNFLQNRDIKKIIKEEEKLKTLDPLIEKSYDPLIFKIFNSSKFLENLKKIEKEDYQNNKKFDIIQFLKNIQISTLIIILFIFFHYLWKNIPFTVLFKNFTINEYTLKKFHFEGIFLSALSIQKRDEFMVYFPGLLVGLGFLGKHLFSYQIFLLFIGNCFGSFFSSVLFDKFLKYKINEVFNKKNEESLNNKDKKKNIMKNDFKNGNEQNIKTKDDLFMPKFHGSSTSLFFLSFSGILRSDYKLINKITPLWIFPVLFFFYELQYLKKNKVYLNESNISHFANVTSICFGAFTAIYFKKYVKLQFL